VILDDYDKKYSRSGKRVLTDQKYRQSQPRILTVFSLSVAQAYSKTVKMTVKCFRCGERRGPKKLFAK
jgi:hypothetical protein